MIRPPEHRVKTFCRTIALNLEDLGDRIIGFFFGIWRSRPPKQGAHLLLAAPTDGSVGDQAMLTAFVSNVTGPVTVIVRSEETIARQDQELGDDISFLVFPSLLYGRLTSHWRDFFRLQRVLRSARSFSVIGADIMDGAYNKRSSARRFRVAEIAAAFGLDSRVMGFSWNAHPTADSKKAMVRASSKVKLYARDPISAERLLRDGAHQVRVSADLAFLIKPCGEIPGKIEEWIVEQRSAGRLVAVLNANYLLERFSDQVSSFAAVIKRGMESDVSFILIPNDSRGQVSDVSLLSRVDLAVHCSQRVYRFDTVLAPALVAEIAKRSDFVITGRMHLAILSLISSTPTIAISYQGKIEGLYRSLGIDYFVEPTTHLGEDLNQQVEILRDHLRETRGTIASNLPALLQKAEFNLENLTAGDEQS